MRNFVAVSQRRALSTWSKKEHWSALEKLRHTRYQLGVPLHASKRIEVNERGELVEA